MARHESKHYEGAMRSSQESHKRSHKHDDMGDSSAPWGHGQHANMPKEVEMSEYPRQRAPRSPMIDDTMRRIDREDDQMDSKRSRYISDQH